MTKVALVSNSDRYVHILLQRFNKGSTINQTKMTIPAVMSRNAEKKGATCKRQFTSPPARRATPVTLSDVDVLGAADDEPPLASVKHLSGKGMKMKISAISSRPKRWQYVETRTTSFELIV